MSAKESNDTGDSKEKKRKRKKEKKEKRKQGKARERKTNTKTNKIAYTLRASEKESDRSPEVAIHPRQTNKDSTHERSEVTKPKKSTASNRH